MSSNEGDPSNQSTRIAGAIDGDLFSCWLCGKAINARAFFCHLCGAVQPPREIDHFKRLGLERRFDLDLEKLDHQRSGLLKALDPARFASRGTRQRDFARFQAEALEIAYSVLRDPGRRGRYLLELAGVAVPAGENADDLTSELSEAAETADCDRLGAKVAAEVAACVTGLAQMFRRDALDEAARALRRLERLEGAAAAIRSRRADLPPPET